ncbi:MAG: V-type ATP synthase subunit C [Archaeoglobaceae archaeon]|nr:V-type ATP synthase subunit C [Archaeoglobaceae archaeon]MDW7989409.1 V-type ATP synthase subunit C [Archaeoglobaceae archaeon]
MFSSTKAAYAYIVARTKVMKSKLLKAEDFRKLLNMDFDEIMRFLEETEYKKEIDEIAYKYTGPKLLDYALFTNLAKTYRKIYSVSFGNPKILIGQYLRRWDVWNLINILRGKNANLPNEVVEDTLVPAGELSSEYLKSLLTKDINEIIKEFEGTIYHEALSKLGSTSLSFIEDQLWKSYYKALISIKAEDIETKVFLNFVKMEIDLRNVKTLLRLKAEGDTAEDIIARIVPGGYELTEDESRKLATTSFDEMLRALEGFWFWKVSSVDDLARTEIEFDRIWIEAIAKRASNYPLSILPVLQYIILKKVEVDDLRILGWGKWHKLPNEELEKQMVII